MVQWTLVYKYLFQSLFSILLGLYLGGELLDHTVVLCLAFWGTAKLFSAAAKPFYILTNNVWEFQFLHINANTCCFLFCFVLFYNSHPIRCEMVLICISLLTDDVEHLFMCLLAICRSLEKYLFKYFVHFYIVLSVLLSEADFKRRVRTKKPLCLHVGLTESIHLSGEGRTCRACSDPGLKVSPASIFFPQFLVLKRVVLFFYCSCSVSSFCHQE